MELLARLDVSLAETSVCVVDENGTVIMTDVVATEPKLLADLLAWRICANKTFGVLIGNAISA